MNEVFKILHEVYDPEVSKVKGILKLSSVMTTRRHSLKLYAQLSRLEIRRNSFAVRVVKAWNSLPHEVVMSSGVKAFEAKLAKYCNDQPVKFEYEEELRL